MNKNDRRPSEEPDYLPPGIVNQAPPGRKYGGVHELTEAEGEENE